MAKNEIPDSMYEKTVLIANMYYKNKMSQQEIATMLNISRPWVSKLLTRAEETGIVKIEVISPFSSNIALEKAIMSRYHLDHVSVIRKTDANKDEVAMAASTYFISNLHAKSVVGVGWGNAVSRMIDAIPSSYFPDVEIVSLAGSFGNSTNLLPTLTSILLAKKTNSIPHVLHTPLVCESDEEYQTLIANTHTQEHLKKAEHADILMLGIGDLETSLVAEYGIMKEKDKNLLRQSYAVGDLALQYMDGKGNPVNIDATNRMIKADIYKACKNAKTVIAMAEGAHKVPIINAVLSQGLVTSFFTDEKTALYLLGI